MLNERKKTNERDDKICLDILVLKNSLHFCTFKFPKSFFVCVKRVGGGN